MTRGKGTGGDESLAPSHVREQGYEPTDVPLVQVAMAGGGLILVLVFSALALWGMASLFGRPMSQVPVSNLEREELSPPAPRLQVNPSRDLAEVELQASKILGSYGWVDRDDGIVRIPIARAMALLAQRGWPQPAGIGRGAAATMQQIMGHSREDGDGGRSQGGTGLGGMSSGGMSSGGMSPDGTSPDGQSGQ